MSTNAVTPQIEGLPPGAVVTPIQSQGIEGLPPGVVVTPLRSAQHQAKAPSSPVDNKFESGIFNARSGGGVSQGNISPPQTIRQQLIGKLRLAATKGPEVVGQIGGGLLGAPGGLPGAVAGSAIGAAGGSASSQLLRRLIPSLDTYALNSGAEPLPSTSMDAASKVGTAGAIGAGSELLGQGVGAVTPALSGVLKSSAARSMEKVLNPTTAENKAITQDIVPQLLQRGTKAFTRQGLEKTATTNAEAAGKALNAAYDNLPADAGVAKQRILQSMEQSKQAFMSPSGVPINDEAIARIDGLKNVINRFGDRISPTDLRATRQIWDEAVNRAGGFQKDLASGSQIDAQKMAADSIRNTLNSDFPDIGKLNAETSFWLNVRKVIGDTNLRKTGQAGALDVLAGTAGMSAGLAHGGFGLHGGAEAAVGSAILLAARKAITSTAWRTTSASVKNQLANAMSNGSIVKVLAITSKIASGTVGQVAAN